MCGPVVFEFSSPVAFCMNFSEDFNNTLRRLFELRRDVRAFRREPLDDALLAELLQVIPLAPSVGLSEPWRVVDVRSPERRLQIIANFERCNAAALAGYDGEDAQRYATLKLSGLSEAPVHLAMFCVSDPVQGKGLGRQTMPQSLHYSVVSAITLLWLAARARGVGLGWVSILQPEEVARALDVPAQWDFIGYLCLGWPAQAGDEVKPELERRHWERRRGLQGRLLHR